MRTACLICCLAVSASVLTPPTPADEIDFNRDVKPILSENCFQCHGPDDAHRSAGLRLDQREGALKPAESGAVAITPGDITASELIARIVTDEPDQHMPPADSGKQLTEEQIETLRRWITEGAAFQSHWAFEIPQRSEVPVVASDPGVRIENAIDNFIVSKLRTAGLHPTPEADRATLIRRVTLDLTGLPPTPAEVDAFVKDTDTNAYEKLVDRLMQSPHYGERMAISWLDYARYADSNGFQTDTSRDMWAWRDWVIHAYNANMPFDQFTVEQIAGDMLPNATRDQIIATGFNRNHRLNGEGGRIEQEWFVETVIDRVETTGLTWLGLTLNCCRCHDHKYDPISQREFYQLFAYFNSVEESGVLAPQGKGAENTPPLMTLMTPELQTQRDALHLSVENATTHQQQIVEKLPELLAAWEAHVKQRETRSVWQHVEPSSVTSVGGAALQRQDDGSWLATGPNPANDEYRIEIPLHMKRLTGILLDVLPDDRLPGKSLGRGSNGNFVLTGVSAELITPDKSAVAVELRKAQADYEQPNYGAARIQLSVLPATGRPRVAGGWAIDGNDPAKKLARKVFFAPGSAVEVPAKSTLVVRLTHDSGFGDHNVGRFRVSISDADADQVGLGDGRLPVEIQTILNLAANARSTDQQQQLLKYFREQTDNEVRQADIAVKQTQTKLAEFDASLPTTMVMKERAKRDAFILTRGEYDRPADKVDRAVPAFLPPLPTGANHDRLGLAMWIVSDTNPLTARVWVNREWERFFGTGLVKTSENFGSQAEYPSHPELLDWLAIEFMRPTTLPSVDGATARAWDMKALQKLILMSATYRQSSRVSELALQKDPENRLLSRGPRFRLSAELIRDQALAVSGLLVNKVGGPSVRPYMPEGVWDETSKYGDLRGYKHEKGEGLYRRTMYTIWKRTAAPPSLLLFDASNREVCTIKRSRTNTPLQALALLNEVTYVEAAKALAIRLIKEGGTAPEDRMIYGFQLVTGRVPTSEEQTVLLAGLAEDRERFAAGPDAVKQLLAVGELPPANDADPVELAAWTMTANVLLNLDEFVTRE
jgi:hypothetical protein